MERKYAATPFEVYGDAVCIYGADGRRVAEVFGKNKELRLANRDFIVRACNSHDALEKMVDCLIKSQSDAADGDAGAGS